VSSEPGAGQSDPFRRSKCSRAIVEHVVRAGVAVYDSQKTTCARVRTDRPGKLRAVLYLDNLHTATQQLKNASMPIACPTDAQEKIYVVRAVYDSQDTTCAYLATQ